MPTYDYTLGAGPANLASGQKVSVVERKLDFAAIAAARTAAGQAALAAADVLKLIPVKAGQYVQLVQLSVEKAEGATATADLGDGDGAAGYISNADLNSAATNVASLATSAYSVAVGGGKLYTADDTIDMVVDHNSIDTAVVRVKAVIIDLRADQS